VEVAEPPRIVVESRSSCGDADHTGELLRSELASARAPGHAWIVKMHVEPAANHEIRAEGVIIDNIGLPIASRVLSAPAGDCRGLARAVGVWASLVLEQEVARSQETPPPAPPPAKAPDAQSTDVLWPAPAPAEKPPPERDWYLHHDDAQTLELGVAGFLMSSAGAGAMAGASPYAIIETGRGVFLRPSVAVGETIVALNSPPITRALMVAARLDACLRLPGLYTKNRGMQLDMCGGADGGFIDDSTDAVTLPYVSVGPSLDLRGELGSLLSASIRVVAGVNVTSAVATSVPEPLFSGRLELAFSWKVK
jgi:hypothetical protein